MSSVYNVLRECCGLSQNEAAEFVHKVRLDTVKSWSSDRRPAPQFAVNQLQSILRRIRVAAENYVDLLKTHPQGDVFIIGHAHDNSDARACGFPSLSVQMHSIAIAVALLPDDAEIRLVPRIRGAIPAPVMEDDLIVPTQTDRQVLQDLPFENGWLLTEGNINRSKFERLEKIGWIEGSAVNLSDVKYSVTPNGQRELKVLAAARQGPRKKQQ